MLSHYNVVLNFGSNLYRQRLQEVCSLFKIHYVKSWLHFHVL